MGYLCAGIKGGKAELCHQTCVCVCVHTFREGGRDGRERGERALNEESVCV